ncbi:MAG: LuxR C-terminal-related transcriptional regulator [Steroidobacteraceae bacterium]
MVVTTRANRRPIATRASLEDDSAPIHGVKAGARGFLRKGASPETLLEAIQTVARGGTYLCAPLVSELARDGIRECRRADAPELLEALTERELEILRLMASGIDNHEIAAALALSEGTAKNHVSGILAKLAVSARMKAVLRAIATGLV